MSQKGKAGGMFLLNQDEQENVANVQTHIHIYLSIIIHIFGYVLFF